MDMLCPESQTEEGTSWRNDVHINKCVDTIHPLHFCVCARRMCLLYALAFLESEFRPEGYLCRMYLTSPLTFTGNPVTPQI